MFRYHFKSKTMAQPHQGMFHSQQKEKKGTKAVIKCGVCEVTYQSCFTSNCHKKSKGHTKWVREDATSSKQKFLKKRKTKQRTINDLLRSAQSNAGNDKDDDEEDHCAASKCIVTEGEDASITGTSCDVSNEVCVGLEALDKEQLHKF